MSAKTTIEWTDRTWNPLVAFRLHGEPHVFGPRQSPFVKDKRGWFCTKVSPGCLNCYAEKLNLRLGTGHAYTKANEEAVEFAIRGEEPWRWRNPSRVFVNSMTDLFHERVPSENILRVFEAMAKSPMHTFQVLTKRAARMREFCTQFYPVPLPNVHLGVSVEDQTRADERIPELLKTPAAVRFLSVEPMLGPVDARLVELLNDAVNGSPMIHWVICGGESGLNARPMHPEWARDLRDQCVEAGVPFFFKQWGEWQQRTMGVLTPEQLDNDKQARIRLTDAGQNGQVLGRAGGNDVWMQRVGKKTAGRLLDGREWSEFPTRIKP